MGSESDEVNVDDSDGSQLDPKEFQFDDVEFDIPHVSPPSLESILWDAESEEGSDTASLQSFQSLTAKFRSLLCHRLLQGLSAQIKSAGDRVNAGLPTVITNSLKYIAIGTSHGYVLSFDTEQNLCWCCYDTNSSDQGAVSALAFNLDSTRLLVGYERGFISMVAASTGDIIRKLPDAHAPQTAVLHLRYTLSNGLALCGDSSGCVFSLTFGRRLGVRTWDSKCLFSGARGEVCVFEPLVVARGNNGHNSNGINNDGDAAAFSSTNHVLVAMATLSKVIVISLRPRLKVLYNQPLPRISTSLPLISWQLVSVGRTFQPVLAWGRGDELNYTRVVQHAQNPARVKLLPLRRCVRLPYTMTALHWLGARHLAVLDTSENLRLIEVRTQRELEVLELASAGLVYGSAHFKALAVGGGVSEAFALAGERACYNSLSSRGDQLLVLGTKAVHLIKLRSWPERLLYLSEQGRWAEALNLAAEEGLNREVFTSTLLKKYLESLNQNEVDKDSLTAAVNCCVSLNKIDILCNELFEAVSTDQSNQDWYYTLITDHILNGMLTTLSPLVAQQLVDHLEKKSNLSLDDASATTTTTTLQNVLLSLDITCMDLHQVLSLCKRRRLYDAWISVTSKTIKDYAGPLTEFLTELTPDNHRLGNTMLVYVSSCLAGLGYPSGTIPEKDVPRVKHDILRCLETVHSIKNVSDQEPTYPYLRALLKYNTRECLNVIDLAFSQKEFSGEMGLLQRQRLVMILLQIVTGPEFTDSQIITLACFVSRLITSNDLAVDENTLKHVTKILTDPSKTPPPLSLRDHSEREQAWLDLLNAKKLWHISAEKLLKLSLDCKCYRVAEYLYEFQKDYSEILTCYLEDSLRKSEVFSYINSYMSSEERCIREQFSDETCAYLRTTNLGNAADNNVDRALEIVRKYDVPKAEAYLLEKTGEWTEALEVLLTGRNTLGDLWIDEAVNLCIRGAEHLDAEGAQKLWLILLQHHNHQKDKTKEESSSSHPSSTSSSQKQPQPQALPPPQTTMSLRHLLHAAAPHVPPDLLLNLVSNANFGDVKTLLQDMLLDCVHDVRMLETTSKLLSKDLHHGLAKSLSLNGKGVSITRVTCRLCQKPLTAAKDYTMEEQMVCVWSCCGQSYHLDCLRMTDNADSQNCPQCRTKATFVMPLVKKSSKTGKKFSTSAKNNNKVTGKQFGNNVGGGDDGGSNLRLKRPDLEGHF